MQRLPCFIPVAIILATLSSAGVRGQEMRFYLGDDSTRFVKVQFFTQFWARVNESNPGSTQLGDERDVTFDIGIRRARVQAYAQVTDRASVFLHYGFNNYNAMYAIGQNRRLQAFFHDVFGEYRLSEGNEIKLGMGLAFVNGLSRFSQPAVPQMPTMDIPVFGQATVEQIDVFGRKLSLTARGQIGPIDYRVALSDPFPITSANVPTALGTSANFSHVGHELQRQAYVLYQFFDHEPHMLSNMAGTYYGKRKVFNIGGGVMHQPRAMWRSVGADTVYEDMLLMAVESMFDMPIAADGTTFCAYVGHFWNDYGTNYLRYNGIMNPANGMRMPDDTTALRPLQRFGGAQGNAFPMFGTGRVFYSHAGVYLPNVIADAGLLPYASVMHANYDRLAMPMTVVHTGISLLLDGIRTRISLDLQNRPTYGINPATGFLEEGPRRSQVVLMYQLVM